MAAQGNNAAHIQSRGLGDGVSEDIKYWNQDAARRREEGRLKDNEAYKREQDKNKEKIARYDKYIKPLNNWETGSQSLTEFQARTIQKAADLRFDAMQELDKTPPGSENYIKLVDRINNLNSTVDNIKPFSDAISARNQEVSKQLESGNIKNNDKVKAFQKAFQNGYSSMQSGFDDNGRLMLAYVDKDGDGKNDLLGMESFDEITKGISGFTFDPNFDIDALAKGAAGELGESTEVNESRYVTDTTIGPLEGTISEKAKSIMVSPDGVLTSEGKSFAQDLGLDPDKEETITAVLDGFKQKMETYVDRTKKKEVDYNAINSAERLNLAKQKVQAKVVNLTEPVTPSDETWDFKNNNIDPNKSNSIGVTGELVLGAVKDTKSGDTYSNAKVKNYTYNEDKKMVLNVEVPITKTISKEDYSDLQSEVDSAETPEAREAAQEILDTAIILKTGGAKITQPGQNEMRTVIVAKENEAEVARQLPTKTIEEAKKLAIKEGSVNSPTNKKTINGF
ncbi:virion structural protein [Cellulophaga phage phi46:3]|uniref:Structural protein n=1 Tax=Cellulophaga phage phi46:3 TaxID=1327985 RepID=S0A333_9CAUD|nr:virion structural protein [Cellulophaga phage phi46:3]AGO48862.1 structural protein [Cellulophaga phage phi46:3]